MRDKFDEWFSADAFAGRDLPEVTDLRQAARQFADAVVDRTPRSADQSNAVRHIRDALHSAVQAAVLAKDEPRRR